MPNNHRTRKRRQEPLPTQPAAIETWNTQFTHLEGVWRVYTTNEGSKQTPGGRRQRQRFLLVQSPFVLHSFCTQLIQEWLLGECSLCIDTIAYCIFPAAGMGFGLNMCTVLDAGMTLSLLHKYCQFFWMQIVTIKKHHHELAASHLNFLQQHMSSVLSILVMNFLTFSLRFSFLTVYIF